MESIRILRPVIVSKQSRERIQDPAILISFSNAIVNPLPPLHSTFRFRLERFQRGLQMRDGQIMNGSVCQFFQMGRSRLSGGFIVGGTIGTEVVEQSSAQCRFYSENGKSSRIDPFLPLELGDQV